MYVCGEGGGGLKLCEGGFKCAWGGGASLCLYIPFIDVMYIFMHVC